MTAQSEQPPTQVYKQVKISVDSYVALAFKEACAKKNISMAAKLSEFMAGYSKSVMHKKPSPDYTTKRQRRAAVKSIVKQLEQIKDFEERYRDAIPENLQSSIVYENADQWVSWLEEALEILGSM